MGTTTTPLTPTKPGPPKELLKSTGFLLKRLGWSMKERSHKALESTGLNPAHYGVLSVLGQGTCGAQGTIADSLGYDRSQLVGLLDELEERGLVARKRDPDDRRRHLVSLTPDGEQQLAAMRSIAKGVEDEFLAPLDADEQQTLHSLLLRLASHHDPSCASKS